MPSTNPDTRDLQKTHNATLLTKSAFVLENSIIFHKIKVFMLMSKKYNIVIFEGRINFKSQF